MLSNAILDFKFQGRENLNKNNHYYFSVLPINCPLIIA